jgi:hypothetical protein
LSSTAAAWVGGGNGVSITTVPCVDAVATPELGRPVVREDDIIYDVIFRED